MIGKQRVGIWRAVVEILIVNVGVEDRYRALFAKLEAGVWRDVESLRAVVSSDCRAVVLAGVCAGDVEPVSVNIDRLTEINIYRRIVGHVEAIAYRFSAGDPWTELDDGRSAARIRRARLEVGAVLIRVLRAVQFSEQRIRVAWRRRTRASFETTRARTVAKEVDYVRVSSIRAASRKRD